MARFLLKRLMWGIITLFLLLPAPLFMIIFGVVFRDVGPTGYGLIYGVVADGFISFFGFNRSYLNWGNIIYQSFVYQGAINSQIAWNLLLPASLALSLFAAAFYLAARGLHLVADPRLRGR